MKKNIDWEKAYNNSFNYISDKEIFKNDYKTSFLNSLNNDLKYVVFITALSCRSPICYNMNNYKELIKSFDWRNINVIGVL